MNKRFYNLKEQTKKGSFNAAIVEKLRISE